MLSIEELRKLSEEGKLTEGIVAGEVRERRDVLSRLVGQPPHQLKLTDEIVEINQLPTT